MKPLQPEAQSAPAPGGYRVASLRWGLAMLLLALAFHAACWWSPRLFHGLGGIVLPGHHLDMQALLAASDAQAAGLDVHQPNPLDALRRPHVYSRWWLGLSFFGLNRLDTNWLSWALVLCFAAAAAWQLAPRSAWEALAGAAFLASFPVVLAAERANNDLVLYLLTLVFCRLPGRPDRLSGVGLLLLLVVMVALKYYPLALVVLLLEARERRRAWLHLCLAALLLLALAPSLLADLRQTSGLFQIPYGIMGTGSASWAQVLRLEGAWVDAVRFGVGLLAFAFFWWRAPAAPPAAPLELKERCFLAGSLLLCACFWLTINHAYRWLFGLLLVPWLWEQGWGGVEGQGVARNRARLGLVLLISLPWMASLCCLFLSSPLAPEGGTAVFDLADRLTLILQVPTWLLFLTLLGYVARFLKPRVLWLLGLTGSPATVDRA